MKKRYFLIGDLKRNALILAASAALGLTTSACESNNRQEETAADEWNADEPYKEGVITEVTETSPDNWKITDEYPTPSGQVAAIRHHLDGKTDTLTGVELEKGMQQYASANPQPGSGFGLWNVLMWGGIGYMAGRIMSPNPRYYANPNIMNRTAMWRNNVNRDRERHGGFTGYAGRSAAGRTDNALYKNSNYSGRTYRTSAPRSGRSGFFSGRSRGYSG
jgi:hypothetical protein